VEPSRAARIERTGDVVAQPPTDIEEQRVAVGRLTVAKPDVRRLLSWLSS
jgi:hypothetical protein